MNSDNSPNTRPIPVEQSLGYPGERGLSPKLMHISRYSLKPMASLMNLCSTLAALCDTQSYLLRSMPHEYFQCHSVVTSGARRTNMVAKVFYATWLAFCIASLPVRVNATENRWKSEKFTIFERQSPDGPRHSPLFSLDVGGDEGTDYPSKMVFFNNDLYGSAAGLVEEDSEDIIGYNQVSLFPHPRRKGRPRTTTTQEAFSTT